MRDDADVASHRSESVLWWSDSITMAAITLSPKGIIVQEDHARASIIAPVTMKAPPT